MNFYQKQFEITGNTGNNSFSYENRGQKTIFVSSFKNQGRIIPKISEGKIAFCEIIEGCEHRCRGLENFYRFFYENKAVYIFDNHNHSFFFTAYEQSKNNYKHLKMIHIDQHKDMRVPDISFDQYKKLSNLQRKEFIQENAKDFLDSYFMDDEELTLAYEYANLILNVGDYIVPLKERGFIQDAEIVDSTTSLKNLKNYCEGEFFLNLDLDFFSKDMDYIDFEEKIQSVKIAMKKAKFILIATSPYFIDLDRCKRVMSKIFI